MRSEILGDHQFSYSDNAMILNTKKTIFNAKIADLIPILYSVKNNVMFIHELLKFRLRDKEDIFEKGGAMFKPFHDELKE